MLAYHSATHESQREGSSSADLKVIPAWQIAPISEVPVKGQALLDYARQDKVFRQLKMTAWPDSRDADMMAGAYQLLLIYRKFVMERRNGSGKGEEAYGWTRDMNSKEFLLGVYRCAVELRISEQLQQKYGKDKWQVKLPVIADYPPEGLYGGIPPVDPAAIEILRSSSVKRSKGQHV